MKGCANRQIFIPYVHNIHKSIHDFGCESGDLLQPMKCGVFKVSFSECLSSLIISWFAFWYQIFIQC